MLSSAQRAQRFRRGRCVAECDRDVAQEALVANSTDRAACKELFEGVAVHREQLTESRLIEGATWFEVRGPGWFGESIPRAYELTVITAIDSIAHGCTQRFGDGAWMLDGQIRDTQARIKLERPSDGTGRASAHAGIARSAMLFGHRKVRTERQIGVHLGKKEP